MLYNDFLQVITQLAGNNKARITIQENTIFFERIKKNCWILHTKVYSGDDYLPSGVRSCMPSSGLLQWQQKGAYLKLDPHSHSVDLFEKIEIEEGKYIPFKYHLSNFVATATEWKETLQSFAESDAFHYS
jgi:hypothetical protein